MLDQSTPERDFPQPTAGRLLRRLREERGVHLGVLAVTLKVSQRQLEALEADQHEVLKSPTFIRALAQTVCRHLGVDATPVLALLPQAPDRLDVPAAGLGRVAHGGAGNLHWHGRNRRHLWVALLAVVIVSGILAMLFWPQHDSEPIAQADPAQPLSAVSMVPEASAATPADVAASAPVGVVAPASAASMPVPAASTPAANMVTASSSVLRIRGKADCWLEVRDAQGKLLINRLVSAGDDVAVDVLAPYSVVLGRAHAVEVTRNGQPLDLAPFTQSNTARFEVKP